MDWLANLCIFSLEISQISNHFPDSSTWFFAGISNSTWPKCRIPSSLQIYFLCLDFLSYQFSSIFKKKKKVRLFSLPNPFFLDILSDSHYRTIFSSFFPAIQMLCNFSDLGVKSLLYHSLTTPSFDSCITYDGPFL